LTDLEFPRVPVASAPPRRTSLFVTGDFPRRRWVVLLAGVAVGVFAAYAWSADLVDDQIGVNTAHHVLGHDPNEPIGGIVSGIVFALVSGMAGSFTACNIAVFGAVGPLVGRPTTRRTRFVSTVRPLGWVTAGMLSVSAAYGFLVGLVGTRMPQFSTARGHGLTPRTAQSMIAFGVVGAVMVVLGLAAAGAVPDPLARLSRRFPHSPLVLMGALIGGFLVGRPYPLFRNLFRHAAETRDPFYGALAFSLQSVGNIIVMALLLVLLSYGTGGRLQRWMAAGPGRIATVTAVAFLVAGVFTLAYWELRVLGRVGYLWWPTAPWNT
jgi:MFS family permease